MDKEIYGLSGEEEYLAEQMLKAEIESEIIEKEESEIHWACGKRDCDCDEQYRNSLD